MAKTVKGKKDVAKEPSLREKFFNTIGESLATTYPDFDVLRMKPVGVPDGILVTAEDKDYYVTVTEKKKQVEYEEEDIKRNFTEEFVNEAFPTEEIEITSSETENGEN